MVEPQDLELILDRVKDVCVTRMECDTTTDGLREMLNSDRITLAEIKTQLSVIKWVGVTIGGCTITILLKMFLGG